MTSEKKCTCHCDQCCDNPLKTWTRAYRLESEAKWLLSMPLDFRQEYLKKQLVQQRREELQREMSRLWSERKR